MKVYKVQSPAYNRYSIYGSDGGVVVILEETEDEHHPDQNPLLPRPGSAVPRVRSPAALWLPTCCSFAADTLLSV